MNNDGNGNQVSRDTIEEAGHRRRDTAALAGLVMALAALWAAVFLFSARSWGEYRPPAVGLQDAPPAPTILLPALTLDEAREILERAAGGGSHGER